MWAELNFCWFSPCEREEIFPVAILGAHEHKFIVEMSTEDWFLAHYVSSAKSGIRVHCAALACQSWGLWFKYRLWQKIFGRFHPKWPRLTRLWMSSSDVNSAGGKAAREMQATAFMQPFCEKLKALNPSVLWWVLNPLKVLLPLMSMMSCMHWVKVLLWLVSQVCSRLPFRVQLLVFQSVYFQDCRICLGNFGSWFWASDSATSKMF